MTPIRIEGDLPSLLTDDRLFAVVEDKSLYEFRIEMVRATATDETRFILARFAYSGEATRTNSWTRAEAEFDRLCAHVMADHGETVVTNLRVVATPCRSTETIGAELITADVQPLRNPLAEARAEVARLTCELDEAVGLVRDGSGFMLTPDFENWRDHRAAFLARLDAEKEPTDA